MFFKIDVPKNFAIFTGRHLCWSLFLIKLQAFIKKRLRHRCFPLNIAKIFKNSFFYITPPVAAYRSMRPDVTEQFPHKSKVVVRRCSVKQVFLNISQNSQENTCASLFFNKVAGLKHTTLLKKRLWHWCFLVNFAKFSRTPFLQNTSGGCF